MSEPVSIEQVFPCVAVAGPHTEARVLARAYGRLGLDVVADVDDGDAPTPREAPSAAPEDVVTRAKDAGATAIHPGASTPDERAVLAQLAEDAGLTFIGCATDVETALRDPGRRAAIAEELGVRAWPGDAPRVDDEDVADPSRCRRIALVLAVDGAGRAEALGELESSYRLGADAAVPILRESPSPHLRCVAEGDAIHEALVDTSVRLLGTMGARGLVTVEFLLDVDDRLYWLGAVPGWGPSLTPVEMVVGIDLAELELRCFSDGGLPSSLDTVHPYGAAVQAQVVAAAAAEKIEELRVPPAPLGRLRVDLHEATALPVPGAGTTLITLTAHGPVRHRALQLLDRVLAATRTRPVETNAESLRQALNDESIRAGFYDLSSATRAEASS